MVGAILKGAYLRGCNMSSVDLRNADLSNVDLSNANLSYSNLKGSSLSYAVISHTNFDNAVIDNVDLTGTAYDDSAPPELVDMLQDQSRNQPRKLDEVLANHIQWIDSQGARGERAILSETRS
jgi:hypothetical protein